MGNPVSGINLPSEKSSESLMRNPADMFGSQLADTQRIVPIDVRTSFCRAVQCLLYSATPLFL
jgi:hypothetical protein